MKKDAVETWELDGFSFEDEAQMVLARKELEGVKYMKANTDLDNPDVVLEMYNRVIEQKLFETPVGYAYLKEMQEYLTTIPYIMNSSIRPIPVVKGNSTQTEQPKADDANKKKRRERKKEVPKKEIPKPQQHNFDFRKRYRASFGINVILIVIVIAMFAIAFTSSSTTIINYENEIINKYESWEQELVEREATVREQEAALKQETQ